MNRDAESLIHIINDAIEIGMINKNGLSEKRKYEGTKMLKNLIHKLEKGKCDLDSIEQEDEEN